MPEWELHHKVTANLQARTSETIDKLISRNRFPERLRYINIAYSSSPSLSYEVAFQPQKVRIDTIISQDIDCSWMPIGSFELTARKLHSLCPNIRNNELE